MTWGKYEGPEVSNIQRVNLDLRKDYGRSGVPLLRIMANIHRLTDEDFARVFTISVRQAKEILDHRQLPPLSLAVRIARYYDLNVEDLFGWRIDDDGTRCPLVYEFEGLEHPVIMKPLTPKAFRDMLFDYNIVLRSGSAPAKQFFLDKYVKGKAAWKKRKTPASLG